MSQVSFAQMLKHPNSLTSDVSGKTQVNSSSAWPALDINASSVGVSLGGWVTMAKQQQQHMSMLGRAKRYQNAPSPWSNGTPLSAADRASSSSGEVDVQEERESMPAPSYKQSFFSAIDESLRLIESSEFRFKVLKLFL